MDDISRQELHKKLVQNGFNGSVNDLYALITEAEENVIERRILEWWKVKTPQHTSIKSIYAHARKYNMEITVFDKPEKASFVLSRKGFNGITLGRVEITNKEIRWCFYKDNEQVGERTNQRQRIEYDRR